MQILDIHHLDVGMGDSTVIVIKEEDPSGITHFERTVVVDCGGTKVIGDDDDVPGQKLLDCLKMEGIPQVDIFVITHWDNDHFGGLSYILELMAAFNPKHHKRRSLEYQAFHAFKNMILYDPGEPRYFDEDEEKWKPYNRKTLKTDYLNFLKKIFDAQANIVKREGNGTGIRRRTERVVGTWEAEDEVELSREAFKNKNTYGTTLQTGFINRPLADNRKFTDEVPKTKEEFAALTPSSDEMTFTLHPGHTILGMDLMNFKAGTIVDGVELICLAVNRNYRTYNSKGKAGVGSTTEGDRSNNSSIGMLLKFHNFSYWLGGDLESHVEDPLIKTLQSTKLLGKKGHLTAMKASHHGSARSTSPKFLKALRPRSVFVSAPSRERMTKFNRYKAPTHPAPVLIERLYAATYISRVYLTGCTYRSENIPELQGVITPAHPLKKFHIAGSADSDLLGNIRLRVEKNWAQAVNTSNFKVLFYDPFLSYRDPHKVKRARKFLDPDGSLRKSISQKFTMNDDGKLVNKRTHRSWEPQGGMFEMDNKVFKKKNI